jgi:hypothetical protein
VRGRPGDNTREKNQETLFFSRAAGKVKVSTYLLTSRETDLTFKTDKRGKNKRKERRTGCKGGATDRPWSQGSQRYRRKKKKNAQAPSRAAQQAGRGAPARRGGPAKWSEHIPWVEIGRVALRTPRALPPAARYASARAAVAHPVALGGKVDYIRDLMLRTKYPGSARPCVHRCLLQRALGWLSQRRWQDCPSC